MPAPAAEFTPKTAPASVLESAPATDSVPESALESASVPCVWIDGCEVPGTYDRVRATVSMFSQQAWQPYLCSHSRVALPPPRVMPWRRVGI